MKDEIIDEIHKHREEFAAKFNYDIDKMFKYLREQEKKSGRKYFPSSKKSDDSVNGKKKAA